MHLVPGWMKQARSSAQPEAGKWELQGNYPQWSKVIKHLECAPSLHSAINPEYMAIMSKALSIGAGDRYISITMRQETAYDGIIFTSGYAPNFVGVVMPMRDSEAPMPKWLRSATIRNEMENRAANAPLPVYEPSDAGPPEGDGRGWRLVRDQA